MSASGLPRGIYYEERRKRYRVRLYKENRVVHRSYHKTIEAAVAALNAAREHQQTVVIPTVTRPLIDVSDQFLAIRSGAVMD